MGGSYGHPQWFTCRGDGRIRRGVKKLDNGCFEASRTKCSCHVWGKRTAISVLGDIVSHATKCSSRGHDHTLSLDRIPNNILLLGRVVGKPGPADYILIRGKGPALISSIGPGPDIAKKPPMRGWVFVQYEW